MFQIKLTNIALAKRLSFAILFSSLSLFIGCEQATNQSKIEDHNRTQAERGSFGVELDAMDTSF